MTCDFDSFIRGLYPPSGELPVAVVFGGRGCESEISVSGAGGLIAAVSRHRAVIPIFIAKSDFVQCNQTDGISCENNICIGKNQC